jgi:hypothetical protein
MESAYNISVTLRHGMQYIIKIHPEQRQTRIPKALTENFGNIWALVPNSEAAVIFREDADLNRVLRSLEILEQDLRLRAEPKKGTR